MCTHMWIPFPQTEATKQTAVTSLMVLCTDVLIKADDLGQEGGLGEKEAGLTERLSKVENYKATLALGGAGVRVAHTGTPGRKVLGQQRCTEVELALQEPRCHGGQKDVGSQGWAEALRLGNFTSTPRRAWASMLLFCLFLPLSSRCAGLDQRPGGSLGPVYRAKRLCGKPA